MELLKPLGIEPDWYAEVPLRAGDRARKTVADKLKGLSGYVLINPGGNWPTKCWHATRYGELSGRLMKDGLPVAVTWGPGEEGMVRAFVPAPGAAICQTPSTFEYLLGLCDGANLFVVEATVRMRFAAAA